MSQFNLTPVYETKLVRVGSIKSRPAIDGSERAKAVCVEYLADSPCERFVALLLDTKNKVIGLAPVTVGTLDASLVHPREAFRPAYLANAASVIFAHNHPSGDLTPSREDRVVMNRLKECGKLLGINVLDFIICNDEEAISLEEM
jgi:DNA repair protein RadC